MNSVNSSAVQSTSERDTPDDQEKHWIVGVVYGSKQFFLSLEHRILK